MKFNDIEVLVEQFNLSDAVALHDELNPKIWTNNKMRPEVESALLKIANDFVDFIGIESLDVEDIVIIGSNVAYSYTPHSDLDLHIVVDIGKLGLSNVYKELFDSKKHQYNDMHDIKIRGIPVELYVQDAATPPASLGMYSVTNSEWIQVPKKQPFRIDDAATKTKYSKLKNKIQRALVSGSKEKIQKAVDTVNRARKSGLAKQGEFSPENLAYKMLRTQGIVAKLWDALAKTRDVELSIENKQTAQVVDEDTLLEINMSPGNLKQLAGSISAKAGMEFEMYVPDASQGDDDYDSEPDYSEDNRTDSIDDIIEFFNQNDYNDRGSLRILRERLEQDYYEWRDDQVNQQWSQEGKDYLRDQMASDFDFEAAIENALEEMELSSKEVAAALADKESKLYKKAKALADDAFEETVDEEWDNQGTTYQTAYEQFQEEEQDRYEEGEWLRDVGLRRMSDVETEYDVTWPFWRDGDTGGGLSVEDVADAFKSAIGRPVNWSNRYHGGKRDTTSYVVEPDGSLDEKNDDSDGGLEFISPPLPIVDMLTDLKKVRIWAKDTGCYTNSSTGLHINVSVDGVTPESLDYTKLALLLGDKYVLDQFERTGNTYCKSAVDKIKANINNFSPDQVVTIMDQMRTGLANLASRAVHSGDTHKYTSINNKNGYIEFRSPGGDWLDEPFEKLENTLLRMVVALDAACSPDKYRQEYLKKLYQMLNPKSENDTLSYFAKYAAGTLPRAALKSFIKQAQLTRARAKDKEPENVHLKTYTVTDATGYAMLFRAIYPGQAEQMAKRQYPGKFRNIVSVVINDQATQAAASAAPSTAAAGTPAGPVGSLIRWKLLIGDEQVYEFNARTQADANQYARNWLNNQSREFWAQHQGEVYVVPKTT